MGYEIKLLVGKSSFTMDEHKHGPLQLSDDGTEAYHPLVKDEDGALVPTGRKETYFSIYAMVDICKPGYDDKICKMSETSGKNEDESHFWYAYIDDCNHPTKEDRYGKSMKPVKIKDVILALEHDSKNSEYRRYKWALDLLRSMETDKEENLEVLFYGY